MGQTTWRRKLAAFAVTVAMVVGTAAPALAVDVSARQASVTSGFSDLAAGSWYMQRVSGKGGFQANGITYLEYIVSQGMMSGYAGTSKFGPNDTLTRAMAATILYRYATGATSSDSPSWYNSTGLDDVEEGVWYTAAVNWAVEEGVVTGYRNAAGRYYAFGPNDPVTREQLAAMIARFAESQGVKVSGGSLSGYADAGAVSSWARSAMASCAASGSTTTSGRPRPYSRFDLGKR